MFRTCCALLVAIGSLAAVVPLPAQTPAASTQRGDRMLAEYFRAQTAKLAGNCLADIRTLQDWQARRDEYRRQLFEMLGLDPLPERTPLHVTYTGEVDHPQFTVRKLHYQSSPGLYVTGNLYVPKNLDGPAPTILYVCGHARVAKGDVSFGNKAGYQHHGAWFARHGYVCLTIDTLQLGEIQGLHHGTYREGMWWWMARGYTPAGVEAWNCIRALDLLETLQEVDPKRIGVTGRSGGGAYSWWIAALDERIACAVPVAGITDLHNHVVDGVVEGHCDCMFLHNTYRWDYPLVAALVAPRPLLISNTDKDPIFPLEGVVRLHEKVRHIYRLHNAADKLGLQITEGPHKDTQELHLHAFVWFDRWLRGENRPITVAAEKLFQPEQLRVFTDLPSDQRNTEIHEHFVPAAAVPALPESAAQFDQQRQAWLAALKDKAFRGWPAEEHPLELKEVFSAQRDGVALRAWDFTSQPHVRLRLYVAHRADLDQPNLAVLNVLDQPAWEAFLATYGGPFAEQLQDEALPEPDTRSFQQHQGMFKSFPWVMAYVAPRCVGPTLCNQEPRKLVQIRRRFMLLGQTLEGMQLWDARRAVQALRSVEPLRKTPLWLQGHRQMAGVALYAALFEPNIQRLDLHQLPASHRQGPVFFNVLRILDTPQAVAMAATHSQVRLYQDEPTGWEYPQQVAKTLGWDEKQIQIRTPQKVPAEAAPQD